MSSTTLSKALGIDPKRASLIETKIFEMATGDRTRVDILNEFEKEYNKGELTFKEFIYAVFAYGVLEGLTNVMDK